jgi:hypothetical protein
MFRVGGFGSKVQGSGFRVQGFVSRVLGSSPSTHPVGVVERHVIILHIRNPKPQTLSSES